MGTLILMVGIPASGKTTMRSKFFPNAKVISPDNFIGYTEQDPWTPQKAKVAWEEADKILLKSFKENKVLVFDATFTNPEKRKKYIQLANRNNFKTIAIYCSVPIDIAIKRNASREEFRQVPKITMDRMLFNLIPPSTEEGFDMVLTFDSVSNKLSNKLPKNLGLED